MKNLKRFITTIVFPVAITTMYAQDFILTADRKTYWTRENITNIKDINEVIVEVGRRIVRVPTSEIVLIEYEKNGLVILQPERIRKVEPVAFDGDLMSFMEKGKRVYIPYSSKDICQRSGARHLRDLLSESDYWEVVYTEDEADIILEYIFDDEGIDHAYLMVSDRRGTPVLSTSSVRARDINPTTAGEESARKLYKNVFEKCILKGKLKNYSKKRKKPNKKNHDCLYFIPLY